MDAHTELGGNSLDAHKTKYLSDAERAEVLKLKNVLDPKGFFEHIFEHQAHAKEESVYAFDKMYTGAEGRAFTVTDGEGKIAGFLGLKKTTEDGFLIDQIRVGGGEAAADHIKLLISQVIAYAKEKGRQHMITVSIPDSADFAQVFSHLGFHHEKSEGEMRVLKWQR